MEQNSDSRRPFIHVGDYLFEERIKDTLYAKKWKEYQKKLRVATFDHTLSPEERGFIRIVCISDTHTYHRHLKLPLGDILIHAGDFSFGGFEEEIKSFSDWLATQNSFKHKIVIAGNHEITFDIEREESMKKRHTHLAEVDFRTNKAMLQNCIYLENESVNLYGYKFYGTPVQVPFHDWGFNRNEEERELIFAKIPNDTDILITHGPPFGAQDKVFPSHEHVGDRLINKTLDRIEGGPLFNIFGHIHEDYGIDAIGDTICLNVANCNYRYKINNPPMIIDLPLI